MPKPFFLCLPGSVRRASSNALLLGQLVVEMSDFADATVYEKLGDLPIFSPDREGLATPAVIKELKLRQAIDRILILCPAPLTIQWQDEMLRWFNEPFDVIFSAAAQAASRRAFIGVVPAWPAAPSISNITRPGWTRAAQKSTEPLPLPIRTSVGFEETGTSGKIRIQTRP